MAVKYTNNAKSTLASGINSSVTSATVADGSIFPALGAGEYFYITFDDGSNNEIAKVTARSGNTLTIVRAQDNTTARAFSTGDSAELRIIAAVLTEIQENIAAKSANQTVYSATAASNATAYNIGVDPGVEANASVFLDGVYQHHDTFSFSGSTLTFDAAPTNGTKIEVVVDNLINLQSSNLTVDTFTATSGQTAFTLSDAPGGEANVLAFIDGVFQNQAAFTLSSNTLTFDTGVVVGRSVTVYTINPVNIGTPSDSTVTSAKLTGNITLPGSLTVGAYDVAFDSPTFFVDHTNSRVGLGTSSPSVPVDIVGEAKISSHFTILDAGSLRVGTGADMVLSSDGTHGTIAAANGNLTLDVVGDIVLDAAGGDIELKNAGNTAGKITVGDATDPSITLDVAGSILLDPAGGEVKLARDGTVFANHYGSSGNYYIYQPVNDKDIIFQGTDNSSTITALTLDMSDAGKATFNNGIRLSADTQLDFGDDNRILKYTSDNIMTLQSAAHVVINIDNNANTSDAYFSIKKDTTNPASGGTELFRVQEDGNVGIGDTDPFTKLHVENTGWSSGAPYGAVASITGNNVNDNNWGHLIVTDSSTANGNGGSIRFATGTADASNLNPFAGIQGVAEGTSYGGLGLYTRPSGGSATEKMRILSTGAIATGGLTSTTGHLHLYQDAAFSGKLILQSQVAANAKADITFMSRNASNTNKNAVIELDGDKEEINLKPATVTNFSVSRYGSTLYGNTNTNQGIGQFIGSIAPHNAGNRYIHVQLSTNYNQMAHIFVYGYSYTSALIQGACAFYFYNNANQTTLYDARYSGSIVAGHCNSSNNYAEIVIDTLGTSTTNRWGNVTIYGGQDNIISYHHTRVVQVSYTNSTARAFT